MSIEEAIGLISKLPEPISDKSLEDEIKNPEELLEDFGFDEKAASSDVEYSFADEELFKQLYGTRLDYNQLWYGEKRASSSFEPEEEYWTGDARDSDVESEMMTDMEAKDAFVNIQYATALGAATEINFKERRKFDMWIKFNRSTFHAFELQYSFTRDIDYGKAA
ncbi:hypothetical protein COV20_01695 [Candidatus Woesearchaeota archaeon CG10_big_fil_rev_8_21_14_0_10_45_16]|nr:MAG: hypothetical protein COV20_01695 [Candidatus Woesearchaeota archaeon CG10_big_fil_rev_8_21_14_0_10_45_16]